MLVITVVEIFRSNAAVIHAPEIRGGVPQCRIAGSPAGHSSHMCQNRLPPTSLTGKRVPDIFDAGIGFIFAGAVHGRTGTINREIMAAAQRIGLYCLETRAKRVDIDPQAGRLPTDFLEPERTVTPHGTARRQARGAFAIIRSAVALKDLASLRKTIEIGFENSPFRGKSDRRRQKRQTRHGSKLYCTGGYRKYCRENRGQCRHRAGRRAPRHKRESAERFNGHFHRRTAQH